jgi:hypothetical protein
LDQAGAGRAAGVPAGGTGGRWATLAWVFLRPSVPARIETMCGRFLLTASGDTLAEHFQLPGTPDLEPRYNIAPTQPVAVVRSEPSGGARELARLRWGLIPHRAQDPAIGNRLSPGSRSGAEGTLRRSAPGVGTLTASRARAQQPRPLTGTSILAWADMHRARTGEWPSTDVGPAAHAPGRPGGTSTAA